MSKKATRRSTQRKASKQTALSEAVSRGASRPALDPSEARFRALLEAAPDALMIHGSDGRIHIVNAQAEKLFGYPREELIGRTMEMLMPDRFRRPHMQHREAYTAESAPRQMGVGMALYALHKDGREIPVEISLSNLGAHDPTMIMSSIRDITERKKTEDALRESQRFALSTLEAIPASLAVLDETGAIISTNESWVAFAKSGDGGIHASGAGANYLAVCDEAARAGDEDARRFAEGIRDVIHGALPRFNMEYPCHSPTGQRWFIGYVTPFKGEGPRHVVVAQVDVSQRKRAEQIIRRLNEELEKRVDERTAQLGSTNEELRREMAARLRLENEILEISEREQQRIGQDLHDDLGQQLVGVWCLSQVLQKNLEARSAPEVADAANITTILARALALTRSLARGLHPVALETGGLVAALKDLASRTADVFGIPCRFKSAASDVAVDNTTSTHLFRIAQEAVTNAVKHARCGHIEINLASAGGIMTLSVCDDGCGLPNNAKPRECMGLRIMRYRADMIGGRLAIAPRPKHGTIVACALDLVKKTSPGEN